MFASKTIIEFLRDFTDSFKGRAFYRLEQSCSVLCCSSCIICYVAAYCNISAAVLKTSLTHFLFVRLFTKEVSQFISVTSQ